MFSEKIQQKKLPLTRDSNLLFLYAAAIAIAGLSLLAGYIAKALSSSSPTVWDPHLSPVAGEVETLVLRPWRLLPFGGGKGRLLGRLSEAVAPSDIFILTNTDESNAKGTLLRKMVAWQFIGVLWIVGSVSMVVFILAGLLGSYQSAVWMPGIEH